MGRFLVLLVFVMSASLGIWAAKHRIPHPSPIKTSTYFFQKKLPKTPSLSSPLPQYPWAISRPTPLAPITKEYFRCKGSSLSPPIPIIKEGKIVENIFDCTGFHSLPLKHDKEYIYPVLIELLNEIQYATKKTVVITSGHRCPMHNRYVDSSIKNQVAKHQIGAEVSFYVSELENHPESVLKTIFNYYQTNPKYAALGKAYKDFQRYDKTTDVSTKPWFNKEIFLKLHLPSEGRNGDTLHSFPYFSIQVRFDIETNMHVSYSWKQSQHFLRR